MPEIPEYTAPLGALKIDLSLKHQGDQYIEHAAEQTRQVARQTAEIGRQRGHDLERGFDELGAGLGGIAAGLKTRRANQAVDEIASQTRLLSNFSVQMDKEYQTQVLGADPSNTNAGATFFQNKLDEFDKLPVPTTPQGREHWETQRANIVSHLQNRTIIDDGNRVRANVATSINDSATSLVSRAKDDPTDLSVDALLKEHQNNTAALLKAARDSGVDPGTIAKSAAESKKIDQDIIENAFKSRLDKASRSGNLDVVRKEIPDFVKKYGATLGAGEADLQSAADKYEQMARVTAEGRRLDTERAQKDADTAVIDQSVKIMAGGQGTDGSFNPGSLGKAHDYIIQQITDGKISGEKGLMLQNAVERQIKAGKEFATDQRAIADMTQRVGAGDATEQDVWAKVGVANGYTARDAEAIMTHSHKEENDTHLQSTYFEGYKQEFRQAFPVANDFSGQMLGKSGIAYADWTSYETRLWSEARKANVTLQQFWDPDSPWRKKLDDFKDKSILKYGGNQTGVNTPQPGPVNNPVTGQAPKLTQDQVNQMAWGKGGHVTPPAVGFGDNPSSGNR